MVRIKRGKISHKRRKRVLSYAKGFRWGRKSKYRLAKDALYHAWEYSFRDRRKKKGEKRALWQTHISAASKKQGISYSKFINSLKKNNIQLDRKILADLSRNHSDIFVKIIETAKT